MSELIICGECPGKYRPEEILAILDDEAVATLAELRPESTEENGNSTTSVFRRAFTGRPRTQEDKGPSFERFNDLRSYTFQCPKGHVVDGNPGAPLGIAILGGSGASKSHWLAAIVEEMDHRGALRKLGVRLSKALYSDPQLAQSVTEVYDRERQLPATSRGRMVGPFGTKLMVGRGQGDPEARQYAMQLFDIAGEDLAEISTISENARFIVMCQGLIVLLDPVDFLSTQFDTEPISERTQLTGSRVIRNGVRAIAETFSEIYGVSSRELEIPVCFVLAKADAIDWVGDFDWRDHTETAVAASTNEEGVLSEALRELSNETRAAFARLGGELVIDEIEETFDPEIVRWAAASATSTMPTLGQGPGDSDWVDPPEPQGVALSVLQVLDAAGLIPRPLVSSPA